MLLLLFNVINYYGRRNAVNSLGRTSEFNSLTKMFQQKNNDCKIIYSKWVLQKKDKREI